MANQNYSKFKMLFLILGAIIIILEIPGALDLKNIAYTGYVDDLNNTITNVVADSPADKAGLKKGDYIISIDGVSSEGTKTWVRKSRPQTGETHTFVVTREREEMSLDLTYSGLPVKDVIIYLLIGIMGLCFLIFGLLPYLKVQTKNSTLLAVVGICFAFAFCQQPYIAAYALRMMYYMVINLLILLGFAFILHFMISFPKVKDILSKKYTLILIYAPSILLTLLIIAFFIFQPESTSGLNTTFNIITGLFTLGYFVLALIAMLHSYIKASREERKSYGLNFMLLATILGFAPIIISSFLQIIAPKFYVAGTEFLFVFITLIPIGLAVAVLKTEKAVAT